MGNVPETEIAHVSRSSILNKRFIYAVVIVLTLTFTLLFVVSGASAKEVTVVVDGMETMVETKETIVEEFLDEQAIVVSAYDKVSVPLDKELEDGDKIVITRAVPVTVAADGDVNIIHTAESNVADLLAALQVEVGEHDKVIPGLQEPVTSGSLVQIVRVKKVTQVEEHPLPFETVKKNDENLLAGKQQVVQEGEKGLVIKTMEYTYEDGELVAQRLLDKVVDKPSKDHIIAVGTKKQQVAVLSAKSPAVTTVTKDGISFDVKKVIEKATLTAYDAGPASTGKSKGDKYYGITASGTKVQEGRTISVDPNVIPMGWWVYIEGYGFRRAEDKGSAVKGNKIDIYFDSEKTARNFGTKKGVKVYVIGPNKPQ